MAPTSKVSENHLPCRMGFILDRVGKPRLQLSGKNTTLLGHAISYELVGFNTQDGAGCAIAISSSSSLAWCKTPGLFRTSKVQCFVESCQVNTDRWSCRSKHSKLQWRPARLASLPRTLPPKFRSIAFPCRWYPIPIPHHPWIQLSSSPIQSMLLTLSWTAG